MLAERFATAKQASLRTRSCSRDRKFKSPRNSGETCPPEAATKAPQCWARWLPGRSAHSTSCADVTGGCVAESFFLAASLASMTSRSCGKKEWSAVTHGAWARRFSCKRGRLTTALYPLQFKGFNPSEVNQQKGRGGLPPRNHRATRHHSTIWLRLHKKRQRKKKFGIRP